MNERKFYIVKFLMYFIQITIMGYFCYEFFVDKNRNFYQFLFWIVSFCIATYFSCDGLMMFFIRLFDSDETGKNRKNSDAKLTPLPPVKKTE